MNLLKLILAAAASIALFVSCGKDVTYTQTPVPSTITCLINCEELPGDVRPAPAPYIQLEFKQIAVNHNQLLCTKARLHGSGGEFDLGCNNVTSLPVLVTSKLRNSGDCQRVTLKTKATNPGNFDTTNYPGHYQVCEQNGTMVWVSIENYNLGGIDDFDDGHVEVTNKSNSRALDWQWKDNKLFICVE